VSHNSKSSGEKEIEKCKDHIFTETDPQKIKITLQMLSILSTSVHYQRPCYSRHACITGFSLLRPSF